MERKKFVKEKEGSRHQVVSWWSVRPSDPHLRHVLANIRQHRRHVQISAGRHAPHVRVNVNHRTPGHGEMPCHGQLLHDVIPREHAPRRALPTDEGRAAGGTPGRRDRAQLRHRVRFLISQRRIHAKDTQQWRLTPSNSKIILNQSINQSIEQWNSKLTQPSVHYSI